MNPGKAWDFTLPTGRDSPEEGALLSAPGDCFAELRLGYLGTTLGFGNWDTAGGGGHCRAPHLIRFRFGGMATSRKAGRPSNRFEEMGPSWISSHAGVQDVYIQCRGGLSGDVKRFHVSRDVLCGASHMMCEFRSKMTGSDATMPHTHVRLRGRSTRSVWGSEVGAPRVLPYSRVVRYYEGRSWRSAIGVGGISRGTQRGA
jgi:hypothetical protein